MKRKSALLATVSALAVLTGCASGPSFAPPTATAYDFEAASAQRIGVVPDYKRTDAQNKALVDKVFNRISTNAQPICNELGVSCNNFQVSYSNKPIVNAQADGRQLVLYAGLVNRLNEHEIAGVVGHEFAHNLAKHSDRSRSVNMAAAIGSIAAGVMLQKSGVNKGVANTAATMGTAIALTLPYSRDLEREADYIGGYLVKAAGYDMRSAGGVWNVLAALNKGKEPPAFLSTHPNSAERQANWQAIMREVETSKTGLPRKTGLNPTP